MTSTPVHNSLALEKRAIAPYVTSVTRENYQQLEDRKVALVIYHRATQRFYASVTSSPVKYFEKLFHNVEHARHLLPAVLRDRMAFSQEIDCYTFHPTARGVVERFLHDLGIGRIATPRGSLITGAVRLYRVYQSELKISRYVSSASGASAEDLIKSANDSLVSWLSLGTDKTVVPSKRALRHAMERYYNRYGVLFAPAHCQVALIREYPAALSHQIPPEVTKLNKQEIASFTQRTQAFNSLHPTVKQQTSFF